MHSVMIEAEADPCLEKDQKLDTPCGIAFDASVHWRWTMYSPIFDAPIILPNKSPPVGQFTGRSEA